MKFRVSEAELARSETAKIRRSREQAVLKAQVDAKKKLPNSCLVFTCDNDRTHAVVRPAYYADKTDHRMFMCSDHAHRLVAYWTKERHIECYVERMA